MAEHDEFENRLGETELLPLNNVEAIVSISEFCLAGSPCRHNITLCARGANHFVATMSSNNIAWLAGRVDFAIGTGNHLNRVIPRKPGPKLSARPIM